MPILTFERSTLVDSDAETVWSHATSWAGVNAELWPFVRMTAPAGRPRLDEEALHHPQISWLMLFGAIPVDRHRVRLDVLDPGSRCFHEHSSNIMMRHWIHRRSIRDEGRGARVTDRCALQPRVACLAPLLLLIYRAVFAHRHRRLRAMKWS